MASPGEITNPPMPMSEIAQSASSGKALDGDAKSSAKSADHHEKRPHASKPACESVVHDIYGPQAHKSDKHGAAQGRIAEVASAKIATAENANDKFSDHKLTRTKDSTQQSEKLTGSMAFPMPDYHDGFPVTIRLGPKDNLQIDESYERLLAVQDTSKLTDFDRQKLRALATADVYMNKYQEALTEREESYAKLMPQPMKGAYLASMALQDGAVVGATKQVLHNLIEKNALGDLSSGMAVGMAIGQVTGKLLMSANVPLRILGAAINIGGIAAGITEIGKLGQSGLKGLQESWDGDKGNKNGLKNLVDGSTENVAVVKSNVEEKLGPTLADAAFFALGIAVARKIGGGKTATTKTKVSETESPKVGVPKTEAPKSEAPKPEVSKIETPKTEAPKTEMPKTDASKAEAREIETSKIETKSDSHKADVSANSKLDKKQLEKARELQEIADHPTKEGWIRFPDGWRKILPDGTKWRDLPADPYWKRPPLREITRRVNETTSDIEYINRETGKPYRFEDL